MLPQEINMLVSYLNLKLRDNYSSLMELCDDLDVSEADLLKRLDKEGFRYNPETNQIK